MTKNNSRAELLRRIEGLADNRRANLHVNDNFDSPALDIADIVRLIARLNNDKKAVSFAYAALGPYANELRVALTDRRMAA